MGGAGGGGGAAPPCARHDRVPSPKATTPSAATSNFFILRFPPRELRTARTGDCCWEDDGRPSAAWVRWLLLRKATTLRSRPRWSWAAKCCNLGDANQKKLLFRQSFFKSRYRLADNGPSYKETIRQSAQASRTVPRVCLP